MAFRGGRKLVSGLVDRVREGAMHVMHAPKSEPPARAEVGGPLDAINDAFHQRYDGAKQQARHDAPVFVVLADELIVFHHDRRSAYSFSPRGFHVIKSVTHAPLAVFASYEQLHRQQIDQACTDQLEAQRRRFTKALASLDHDARGLAERTRQDLRLVLQSSVDFIDLPVGEGGRERLDGFARALGPVLLRLADDATGLQLDALHTHVEAALARLTQQDLAGLHVVVAGGHQARERSLAIQYFRKRMREPEGREQRVCYAEGVSDEAAALALVGTRRLDHAIGEAFFGDAQRLQRDVLGDAARARLADFELRLLR
jgi:hypothetical protein